MKFGIFSCQIIVLSIVLMSLSGCNDATEEECNNSTNAVSTALSNYNKAFTRSRNDRVTAVSRNRLDCIQF